jgi:hypothetical protein
LAVNLWYITTKFCLRFSSCSGLYIAYTICNSTNSSSSIMTPTCMYAVHEIVQDSPGVQRAALLVLGHLLCSAVQCSVLRQAPRHVDP